MKIIRADNGASIDITLPSSATVDNLKQKVYENYNIPVDQQILLCEGTKLPAQKSFAELGLTQDKQIFLYDKRQLGTDSAPPSETYYEIPLINLPEQSVFVPIATDTVHVRNLKQYEQKFSYQYNIAKAILDSSDAALRMIIQSHVEQQNQILAIRSAIANLNDYDRKLLQIFDPFTEYVSRKQEEHDKLFKSMESTLQKLRDTKLDPALCDEQHKSLIDYIPVDKMRDWAKRCKEQDDMLRWRFGELSKSIKELDQNVKIETDRPMDFDVKQQQDTIKLSSNKVEDVKAITSAFWNDLQKLQSVLKVTMQSGGNVSEDMYDGFKAIITAHTNNLVFLNTTHREISELLKSMAQSKTSLSRLVHERLKGVSLLQSKITTVQHKIAGKDGFRTLLMKHKKDMFQLVYLECLIPAYDSYLHEIKRRRSWHRKLLTELQKLRLRLENITNNEKKQREKYTTEYGIYIPKELISRLPSAVPSLHIETDGVDEDLPDVEGDFSVDLDWRSNFFGNASDMHIDEDMRKIQESKSSPSNNAQSLAFSASISEKLRSLQDELERKRKEAKNYKLRVQELETKVNLSAFTQSHSPSHSSGDSSKLVESQNTVKKLEDQVQRLETKLKDTETQYQTTQATLEDEIKQKTFAVSKIEDNMAATNEEISRLKNELSLQTSENNAAKSKITELQRKIEELTNQINSYDLKASELSQQISESDMEKKVIAEEKRSFVQQITELSKQKVVLSEKVEKLQQDLTAKSELEENLRREISDLQSTLKTFTEERNIEQEKNSKKLADREAELGELKEVMAKLRAEVKQSDEKIQQLMADHESHEKELNSQLENYRNELEKAHAEKHDLAAEIKELSQQVIDLQATSAQHKETANLSEDKNKILTKQIEELEKKLTDEKSSFNKKEQSLDDIIKTMVESQEKSTKEFESEKKSFTEQIRRLKEELDEKSNQNQKSTTQVEELTAKNRDLTAEIQKLSQELKKVEEDFENYQDLVKTLQRDNEKLEENLASSVSISEMSKKEIQEQLDSKTRTVKIFEETVKRLTEESTKNNEESKKKEALINSLKKNEESNQTKLNLLEKELTQLRDGLTIIESTTKSSPSVNNLTVPERVTRILNHWDQTSKGGREIEQHIKAMEKALQEAKAEVTYKDQLITVHRQNSIAMNSFEGGCLVAFRPNAKEYYEIWNIGAPNYYLNPEDEHIFQQEIRSKVVILGFIVALEKRTATEKDNPFKLPIGTDFHLVTAERLQ